MSFNADQIKRLRLGVRATHVRERDVDDKTLRYLEGWFVIAEANRIFGHDGWDREIVATECVWRKVVDGLFAVAYLTRVRVTVRADGQIVSREGVGAGQFMAPTMGQAHERAAKAAETDATKRALVTFGAPFGLMLYKDGRAAERRRRDPVRTGPAPDRGPARAPRVIKVPYSARSKEVTGARSDPDPCEIDMGEPCLVCGARPAIAHRLEGMRSRAGEEGGGLAVPLCVRHQEALRESDNENEWWEAHGMDPLAIAEELLAMPIATRCEPLDNHADEPRRDKEPP